MKAEQLRKSILQLAIQGKLVPQDPNDEPASVLLDRIRAEKQKLIKEGKIKKDKTDSIIFKGDDNCYYEKVGNEIRNITEEIPFEIPDSWCWIRIKSVFDIRNGFTPLRTESRYWNDGTIPWFTIEDIRKNGNIIYNTEQKINKCAVTEERLVPENSFLICCTASVGVYAQTKIPLTTNQQFNALSVKQMYKKLVNDNWLFTIGAYFSDILHSLAGKTTFEFISVKKISDILIPIPSFNEQTRISKEIRKYEPLIAEYDKLEQQSTKLDNEIKDKLKKSILQYAIQGKLVEQDPNDEPASVLLEKIRAEKKAKLGKKYVDSYIYKGDDNCYYEKIGNEIRNITEEVPDFNIPESWGLARIDTLISVQTGASFKKELASINKNLIRVLRGGNINHNNYLFLDSDLFIPPNYVSKDILLQKNDLITPAVTSLENIGKIARIKQSYNNVTAGSFVFIFRPYMNNEIISKYFLYCFQSSYMITLLKSITKKSGQAFYNLGKERLIKLIMPIPPYNEQVKICNQIEKILNIISKKTEI